MARPEGWLPGSPARWEALGPGRSRHVGLSDVRRALAGGAVASPPGLVSDLGPAELPPRGDDRPAAVLCLLFERAEQAHVVLTRRSPHLRYHAGEVSFPGGRLEPGESPLEAALREAEEEIGAVPGAVEVLGELSPLTTRGSPAPVHCFVAAYPEPGRGAPALAPRSVEVDRVFTVALADLVAPGAFHEELWPAPGSGRRAVPFFDLSALGEDVVWGATGRMLAELVDAVLAPRLPA